MNVDSGRVQDLIRAVTFDLWNTLIENRDYTAQRINFLSAKLEEMGYSFAKDDLTEAFVSSLDYVYRVWETENHRFVPNMERLEYILQKLKAQVPEDQKKEIVTFFEEVALKDPPPLIKEAKGVLEYLRSRYQMAIISDSGFTPARILRKILQKNGVLDFFVVTVFSDEVGFNKPHRMMFERVFSRLSVKPSEALHVGDLLHTDVAGAKAFGMKSIWLNKEKERKAAEAFNPDFTVNKVCEIIEILNNIGQQEKPV
ncbi:HAD family hydrolase [Candidatus Bathyarchaeota archaeon]|nr:HAD family hydrolase [Candidatus Bathyarchaeota archaeon]